MFYGKQKLANNLTINNSEFSEIGSKQMLMQDGADRNASVAGQSPLQDAYDAFRNNDLAKFREIVKSNTELLNRKYDTNLNKGTNLLQEIVASSSAEYGLEYIEYLVENGADATAKDANGDTALTYATKTPEISKFLQENKPAIITPSTASSSMDSNVNENIAKTDSISPSASVDLEVSEEDKRTIKKAKEEKEAGDRKRDAEEMGSFEEQIMKFIQEILSNLFAGVGPSPELKDNADYKEFMDKISKDEDVQKQITDIEKEVSEKVFADDRLEDLIIGSKNYDGLKDRILFDVKRELESGDYKVSYNVDGKSGEMALKDFDINLADMERTFDAKLAEKGIINDKESFSKLQESALSNRSQRLKDNPEYQPEIKNLDQLLKAMEDLDNNPAISEMYRFKASGKDSVLEEALDDVYLVADRLKYEYQMDLTEIEINPVVSNFIREYNENPDINSKSLRDSIVNMNTDFQMNKETPAAFFLNKFHNSEQRRSELGDVVKTLKEIEADPYQFTESNTYDIYQVGKYMSNVYPDAVTDYTIDRIEENKDRFKISVYDISTDIRQDLTDIQDKGVRVTNSSGASFRTSPDGADSTKRGFKAFHGGVGEVPDTGDAKKDKKIVLHAQNKLNDWLNDIQEYGQKMEDKYGVPKDEILSHIYLSQEEEEQTLNKSAGSTENVINDNYKKVTMKEALGISMSEVKAQGEQYIKDKAQAKQDKENERAKAEAEAISEPTLNEKITGLGDALTRSISSGTESLTNEDIKSIKTAKGIINDGNSDGMDKQVMDEITQAAASLSATGVSVKDIEANLMVGDLSSKAGYKDIEEELKKAQKGGK